MRSLLFFCFSLVACASLKHADDGATETDGGRNGGDPSSTSSGNGGPGSDASSEGGGSSSGELPQDGGPFPPAKTGDPRWPLGPVPADERSNSSFAITNTADGALVADSVTGLVWQDKVAAQTFSFVDAQAYCDGLVYGGFDDWRAPTRIEAASLLGFSTSATIDFEPTAFSPIGQSCVWTASRHPAVTPQRAWRVTGSDILIEETYQTCGVRCVRNAPSIPALPSARQYLVQADTVTDPVTGLVWERTPPTTPQSWADASARCASVVLDGHAARLPTVKELLSITDETKATNPISTEFRNANGAACWTKPQGWVVSFDVGQVYRIGTSHLSRCVASL